MSQRLVESVQSLLDESSPIEIQGSITRLIGLIVESSGPPASVGEICRIFLRNGKTVTAEVVGFREDRILLMPLGSLQGISMGDKVVSLNKPLEIKLGPDLLGKILNGLGEPIDPHQSFKTQESRSVLASPPNPLTRPRIKSVLATGIRSIDSLLTLGKGQRIGIFSGSGVGKSVLMGMIARKSTAHVNVIALVGERGREVRDFLEKDLGEEGMKRSVIVVATSDQPAIIRVKCGLVAMTIAEYFRDAGMDVMFMMDSVTRIALSLREIGLAIGEPPTTKAYTPSVFAFLPQLLERAGNSVRGSITGIFTVLVEGSDMEDPIADAVRSILDGHVVLTRKLAERKHFPAVDILQSISRLMSEIVETDHLWAAEKIFTALAVYQNSEDLINIGAYVRGTNKELDKAIELYPRILSFLKQDYRDSMSFEETLLQLQQLVQE